MKHAELFAGYGGLGLAVEAVFGAELAWYAEFDPAPSKIMARHWPDAPNYGDVTTVQWAPNCPNQEAAHIGSAHRVEVFRYGAEVFYMCLGCHWRMDVEARPAGIPYPVDIISGGSPCQDVSAAGRRAGMNEGTRSNLWVAMRDAISIIKPTYVIWENVRGAHSAKAHSAVESEPGLLGESRGAYLRATGRVVGDLAELGYDAEWRTVSAASVGAPHRRERVFVLAWRRDATAPHGHGGRDRWRPAPSREGSRERADAPALLATRAPRGTGPTAPVALLPTPCAQPAGNTPEDHLRKKPGRTTVTDLSILVENDLLRTGGKLLPTPLTTDAKISSEGDTRRRSVPLRAQHLLPTPAVADVQGGRKHRSGARSDELLLNGIADRQLFGAYEPAISRWEQVAGRPAPPPTVRSPRGKHRLSEHFTEWMMGLPAGWICDTQGITRNDKIKAAGNGVVPQQAAAALADMLQRVPVAQESAA